MATSDLAEYFQVSKSSLCQLMQHGTSPGHKVGRHWRFHKVSIDRWPQESSVKHSRPSKK